MTATLTRGSLFASPRAQRQAHELADHLDAESPEEQTLALGGVELGDEILSLLHRIITIIGEGGTVTVGSMPETITTTVAADVLGVSRTTLMKYIRNGELPSHQVGSHTKLRRDDVLAFRRARLEKQREALDKLLAMEEEFDIT